MIFITVMIFFVLTIYKISSLYFKYFPICNGQHRYFFIYFIVLSASQIRFSQKKLNICRYNCIDSYRHKLYILFFFEQNDKKFGQYYLNSVFNIYNKTNLIFEF